MRVFFGTVSNDPSILKRILMFSDLNGATVYQSEKDTATEGWNELLEKAEGEADIAVLCHHDMYFPPKWLDTLKEKISELPDSWIVAGFFGINEDGDFCGKIHDRRIPLPVKTEHELPMQGIAIDGCALVFNLAKGFRYEPMPGFDLYDVYAVLRAKEMGGTAWIIDCLPEHYATRPFNWKPGELYMKNWNWLKTRFPNEKVISTCFRDDGK